MSGIKENVWAMQNELRNKEGITGIDAMHHVLMVLLSKSFTTEQCEKLNIPPEFAFENLIKLNKSDLYSKFYNQSNMRNTIIHHIRRGDNFGYNKDSPFQIKNESTLEFMFHRVNNISTKELMNKYDVVGDIYEHFINREGKTMKDLGQYFTDRGLIKYLVQLCNPQLNDGKVPSVWDPSSGTGGFIIEYIKQLSESNPGIDWSLNKNNLFANDINKNTYTLLKQNLYYSLNEVPGITIKLQDSLITNDEEKYDYILANPPFGIKGLKYKDMNSRIKSLGINGTKGEILFLQLCMCKLKDNGKCAIVVPEGVMFNSTKMYRDTRKYLLENFNLRKVIKVGDGEFFKNTGVKTSVLFFEKTGKTEKVEFVQVNKGNDSIEEDLLMEVEMDKIIENDYSLNMNFYKETALDVSEGVEVVDLGKISSNDDYNVSPSSVINSNGKYKYFTSSKTFKTCDEYTENGEYIIKGTHGNIEGTLHYVNGKFACGNNLLKIKINDDVNTKYVYYFLKLNPQVFEFMGSETIIKFTSYKELSKCKIILPSLEVQNRIVKQLDNIYGTEIESSKKLVDSLKMSIETIMNNTMYRDDIVDYTLKESCIFRKGKGIPKSKRTGGVIPYYASNGHSSNSYMDTHNIEGNFILLAEDGYIGSIHYIPDGSKIWVGDHVHVINPKEENNLNIKFLYHCLHNNVNYETYTTGSVIPKLNKGNLEKIKIKVPPIDVQKDILKKIESKESLIKELEKNIERAEQESKEIMDSVF